MSYSKRRVKSRPLIFKNPFYEVTPRPVPHEYINPLPQGYPSVEMRDHEAEMRRMYQQFAYEKETPEALAEQRVIEFLRYKQKLARRIRTLIQDASLDADLSGNPEMLKQFNALKEKYKHLLTKDQKVTKSDLVSIEAAIARFETAREAKTLENDLDKERAQLTKTLNAARAQQTPGSTGTASTVPVTPASIADGTTPVSSKPTSVTTVSATAPPSSPPPFTVSQDERKIGETILARQLNKNMTFSQFFQDIITKQAPTVLAKKLPSLKWADKPEKVGVDKLGTTHLENVTAAWKTSVFDNWALIPPEFQAEYEKLWGEEPGTTTGHGAFMSMRQRQHIKKLGVPFIHSMVKPLARPVPAADLAETFDNQKKIHEQWQDQYREYHKKLYGVEPTSEKTQEAFPMTAEPLGEYLMAKRPRFAYA